MAFSTKISNVAALAACDAIVDLLDSSTAPGTIGIYDGAQPTDVDTAITSQVKLAELTLSSTAFGGATDNAPGAKATANAITADTSADASGTATWFRAFDGGGTAVIDGSVGESGSFDLIINDVTINVTQTVSASAWEFIVPEYST